MKRVGYYVSHMKAPHYGDDSGDIGGAFKNEDRARQFAREHVEETPLGIYRVHSRRSRRDLVTTIYPRGTGEEAEAHPSPTKKSTAQLNREIADVLSRPLESFKSTYGIHTAESTRDRMTSKLRRQLLRRAKSGRP
jgi:hypothetical protein